VPKRDAMKEYQENRGKARRILVNDLLKVPTAFTLGKRYPITIGYEDVLMRNMARTFDLSYCYNENKNKLKGYDIDMNTDWESKLSVRDSIELYAQTVIYAYISNKSHPSSTITKTCKIFVD
jgi:hypothetical protein